MTDKRQLLAFRVGPKTKKQFQIKLLQNNTTQQEWLENKVLEYIKEEDKNGSCVNYEKCKTGKEVQKNGYFTANVKNFM